MARHDRAQRVVVEAVEERVEIADVQREIVASAEGEHALEMFRMAQRDGHGVIRAEAAAVRRERRARIQLRGKGEHLLDDVALVSQVPRDALLGRFFKAVEALLVEAIHADELERRRRRSDAAASGPCRDLRTRRSAACATERRAGADRRVAEDEQLHLPAERGAVPLVIFAVHGRRPSSESAGAHLLRPERVAGARSGAGHLRCKEVAPGQVVLRRRA